jgi:hypothetical protein
MTPIPRTFLAKVGPCGPAIHDGTDTLFPTVDPTMALTGQVQIGLVSLSSCHLRSR